MEAADTMPEAENHRPDDAGEETGFWTPVRILVLVMLLALAVRILATSTRSMIQFDETAYVRIAENLASGKGPLDISGLTTTHFTLLLPMMITALAFVLGDYVLSGYVIVTIFGVLVLVPTFLLGKELAGERVGLMAAALVAVSPIFVGTSEYIYTENIFIFFLLMSIFFIWQLLRRWRLSCASLAAVSLGLAYLANPLAVLYLVLFLVLAIAVALRKGVMRRLAVTMGLFLAVFFIVASPYIIFLHGELGRWTLSGKESFAHNNFAATHDLRRDDVKQWEAAITALDESGEEIVALSIERIGIMDFFLSQPAWAAKIFLKQSYEFYTGILHQVIPLWLLPLIGLGLFGRGWNRRRAAGVGYLSLMMLPGVLILAMLAFTRFFMPFVPLAMIWVGQGWQRLEQWGGETAYLSFVEPRSSQIKRRVPWLVGIAVLLPVLAMSAATTLKQDYPVEYKEAGQWLKQAAGPETRVLNRDFSSAYYAGGTAVLLPTASYEDTTDYARRKDVDYLIISTGDIEELRPDLSRLVDPEIPNPGWELVHVVRPGTERETLIFRFEEAEA